MVIYARHRRPSADALWTGILGRDLSQIFGQGSVQVLTEFSLIPLCTVRYSPGLSATPWPFGPVFYGPLPRMAVCLEWLLHEDRAMANLAARLGAPAQGNVPTGTVGSCF